jgi:hypothetical protein
MANACARTKLPEKRERERVEEREGRTKEKEKWLTRARGPSQRFASNDALEEFVESYERSDDAEGLT